MMTSDIYRAQAAEALAEASKSSLENVRDRCERSARVWLEMADRLELTEAFKARNTVSAGSSAR